MTSRSPQPGDRAAKYRLARNVHEGWEIRLDSGQWTEVVDAWHITSPLKMSTFNLAGNVRVTLAPTDEVMSRKVAQP